MCTAYELGKRGGSWPEWLQAEVFAELMAMETRIVRPTHTAPVIIPDGSLRSMIWGFRRPVPAVKTKQRWTSVVNSREDKLKGRTWSRAFAERRCLIPASAFYEWIDTPKGKAPLRFEDAGGSLLWIAGIWEFDSDRGECYSMITTEPSSLVAPVHDRMPAVLASWQVEPYLSGELQEFGPSSQALVYAAAENFLRANKPDDSSLDPIPRPDQGELF